jgi:signal transduction histidine kinase
LIDVGLNERIEGHELSGRLNADGNDELGRLCASFDRMLERLEAAFSRERRFVADASHELRAPLAVLRAETELALRRERSGDEYRAALASIAREGARLEELVNELLATARAEVDAREQQTLDTNELLSNLGDRVRATAATRGIEIRIESNGVMLAQANRATLERALLAIAHNAIRYGRDDGTVRMRSLRDDGLVRIEIVDDGPGFTSDALAHATERFWRGDTARQRDGTGLGLAIARLRRSQPRHVADRQLHGRRRGRDSRVGFFLRRRRGQGNRGAERSARHHGRCRVVFAPCRLTDRPAERFD